MGTKVRAKVNVESIANGRIVMTTVYEGDTSKDTENARFTKATPSGRIEMAIDNESTLSQFKVGQSYYVDFSDAPK